MSLAERIYRAALLAYPPSYREVRGDEILGTLAEAGGLRVAEVAALVTGGLRRRGIASGATTRRSTWAASSHLAAFVLLILAATSYLYPLVNDLWYARLGMHWPRDFTSFPMAATVLLRGWVAVLLALIPAAALCRGRLRIAFAGTVALTAWVLLSGLSPGLLSALAVVPLILLWPRAEHVAPPRHSPAWLAVPFAVSVLSIGFYISSLTFWPVIALLLAWCVLARWDPRLGFAAALVAASAALYLIGFQARIPYYEHAPEVALGCFALALAALAAGMRGVAR